MSQSTVRFLFCPSHPQPVEPCALGLRLTGPGDLTFGSHARTLWGVRRRVANNECSKTIFAH